MDDLAAMADSAWWLGLNKEALAAFEEAFGLYERAGRVASAAKLALDIGFLWMLRGEVALGEGWVSRGRRLLRDLPDCVEQGYGLAVTLEEAVSAGRFDDAVAIARDVQACGARFQDSTLHTVGMVGEGIALIRAGRAAAGWAVLDEAMLPVAAGHVTPDWTGNIYCQMMAICHDLADLRRARYWTDTTERWCGHFSPAVMFLGVCRMHRVRLLAVQGDWSRAEDEAWRVGEELADLNVPAVAESHYQIGEIRRLRGDLAGADASYSRAHQLGRDPQPGLALLRLAEGRIGPASASIRAGLAGCPDDPLSRAPLLAAQVEIALAKGDVDEAIEAAGELELIAGNFASPGLQVLARQAAAAASLARGSHADALRQLREAVRRWQDLDVPYEAARSRVMAAQAYRAIGDREAAILELEAAAAVFEALGAAGDATQVELLMSDRVLPGSLTVREVEVLSCVAAGQTNREVAAALFISEKTVARHLSNIFTKLAVSSRTEAAAFAFSHGLMSRRRV